MDRDRLGPLAFAGATLLWGSTFLAISIGNDAFPPIWSAALRLGLAATILSAAALATRQPFPRGPALVAACWFGFLQFGVNFALLYWGERVVPSGIAAVFYATGPLIAGLLGWLLGVERPDAWRLAAAVAGLAGVALVVGGEALGDVPLVALVAVFAAATAASASGVLLRRAPRQAVLPLNAVGSAVGIPVCLAASLLAGEEWRMPVSVSEWGPILYLTLAGSLGAFLLFSFLVQVWPVSLANMAGLTVPVVALVLGAIFRAERPHALSFVGAAVVLASVGFALARAARARPAAAR